MASLSVIGSAVGGFRILAPLGVGGTGAVYLAEHPLLGRRVAVKILHPQRALNTEAVGRFVAEMRAAQALGHPGIAQVVELTTVKTAAGELPCIVMELLEGRTLAEVIADEAPLAPARAIVIAELIAEILTATHARGIVHRNLKSENVFVLGGFRGLDEIKLLDFGIARLGSIHGTPAYLSPEQCLGFSGDESADVYGLGVLLFEMLTARLPYRSRGLGDLVIAHLAAPPPRPSQHKPTLPEALDAIVARALEKNPARRFPTMAAMLEALRDPSSYVTPEERAPAPEPAPAAPRPAAPAPPPAPRRPAQRLAAPIAAAFAAAATLLALVSVLAAGERQRPHRPAAVHPAMVKLTISSCAPGARVFLDGAEAGAAGESFSVPAGRAVEIVVRAPRFMPYQQKVVPAHDERLEAVLLPETADLTGGKPEA